MRFDPGKFRAVCLQENRSSNISFKEKGSQLILSNPNREKVYCIEVDDCQIKGDQPKCDALAVTVSQDAQEEIVCEYFIELKGSDILRALKQLQNSIRILSVDALKGKKVAVIVHTRSPQTSAQMQNHKIKFRDEFNAILKTFKIKGEIKL